MSIPTRLRHPAKLARQAAYWRAHGRLDVAERLEAELQQAGRCRRCGRTLTDPDSMARDLGPDCARLEASADVTQETEVDSDSPVGKELGQRCPGL